MIKSENGTTIIQCDKCKKESTAPDKTYNDMFWNERWSLVSGRKYEHLCYDCLPNKKKDTVTRLRKLLKP